MTTKELTPDKLYAVSILQSARDYLRTKTYNGDQGGDYMHFWEWQKNLGDAFTLLNDMQNAIYFGDRCRYESPEVNVNTGAGRFVRCKKTCMPGSCLCEDHQRD